MSVIQDVLMAIIVMIVLYAIIVSAFIPRIADWKSDLSSVNEEDYGWVVDVSVLAVLLSPLAVIIGLFYLIFKKFKK